LARQIFKTLILVSIFFTIHVDNYAQLKIFVSNSNSLTKIDSKTICVKNIFDAINLIEDSSFQSKVDITIFLEKGNYFLEKPVLIENRHAKKFNSLTIRPFKNTDTVTLSGGKRISNFENYGKNVYRTFVGNQKFRQIYIGDSKGIRSRHPNLCRYERIIWDNSIRKYKLLEKQEPFKNNFRNPVELHLQRLWAYQIARIKEVVKLGEYDAIEVFNEDNWFEERKYLNRGDFQYFHFENSLTFLDQTNEWFLDIENEYIYIYHDNFDYLGNVVIPTTVNLIKIIGEKDHPIENVRLENLSFCQTNWIYPSKHGMNVTQSNWLYPTATKDSLIAGAVVIENAKNIDITGCIFRDLGGAGLVFNNGVHDSKIEGSVFKNISSNGIAIDWDHNVYDSLKSEFCSNIIIKNNVITKIGQDYKSASGICVGMANNILIEKNFIYDLPYTGISVGYGHTLENTILGDNVIRYNFIDRVLSELCDGGAIYTLSSQPGTTIYGNLIQNISKSPWAGIYPVIGIYLDEGSNQITIFDNIIRDVEWPYHDNSRGGINSINQNSKSKTKQIINAGLEGNYHKNYAFVSDPLCDYFENDKSQVKKISLLPVPNPTSNTITIYDPGIINANKLSWRVINNQGIECLMGSQDYKTLIPLTIDLSNLKSGLYVLLVQFDNLFYGEAKIILI
jgi:hypothetical protein